MPKKLLIVSRYFWPDKTPESEILFSLATFLVTKGHSVDVLSSYPSDINKNNKLTKMTTDYNNGVKIMRINLSDEKGNSFLKRIINSIQLGLNTFCLSLKNKYEIIIASSNPPVIGPFSAALSSLINRSRFIYYCMDITPEVGLINDDFKTPFLYKLLEIIDNFSCLSANPVIVHSKDMKETLLKRKKSSNFNIKIINNFAVKSKTYPINEKHWNFEKNKLTIIYAGNLGRFQGLETAIYAMSLINQIKDVELIFMGKGSNKNSLIELSNDLKANVRFIPYCSYNIAKNIIKEADLGLISLSKNVYKYSYPSKTMTYLEQGKPIIGIVENHSQIAKDIVQSNCGYVVEHREKEELANLFIHLKNNPKEIEVKSSEALKKYNLYFSESVILKKWLAIINDNN